MRPKKILVIVATLLLSVFGVHQYAQAGCYINLVGKNGSGQKMWLDPFMSKVKIQGGSWKRVFAGKNDNIDDFTIQAGADYTHVYKAGFGCRKKRRYKFVIRRAGCEKAIYIPLQARARTQRTRRRGRRMRQRWETGTTVDLGDISRHCP